MKELAKKPALLLGAHMSIEGGIYKAFSRGESLGCSAIQVFTKNASQWKAKALSEDDIDQFQRERRRTGIDIVAHDAYLINIGSPKAGLRKKSIRALMDELDRAEALQIPFLVMHPGAHTGSGEHAGLRSIVRSLDNVLEDSSGYKVNVLLENTAGQGSALGYSFEHLQRIINESKHTDRLGVCLDTCHAFAAGYDLRSQEGYKSVMEHFDRLIGMDRLHALHLNDCKKGLGMRVDRHEHIGLGDLGAECFRLIMNDPRFLAVPKLLETPKELHGKKMDVVNLNVLRSMIGQHPET